MNIFYIDDDPDDLDLFAEIAIFYGTEIIPVNESTEVIDTLSNAAKVPELILLDINMPVMSGFDLLIEIRRNEKLATLPVAILSTSNEPAAIKKCWDFGADLFIRKGRTFARNQAIMEKLTSTNWKEFERNWENFFLDEREL